MTPTWNAGAAPDRGPHSLMDWLRIGRRGLPLVVLVFGGLLIMLLVRQVEAPFFGPRRPVTPHITQVVCRNALRLIGLRYRVTGSPMTGAGAVVANHASWLDIFVLNARKRVYFVAKSEVAGWPGIGWLARATGTVFIARDRREAASQVAIFRQRLSAGHRLLFFPEGTSTDGRRVLAFKPTLFAAFLDPALRETLAIQPVTVDYTAPTGEDARFYGWWGEMDFAPHLLATLAARRQGTVTVTYHAPVRVAAYTDRKALARDLETTVRNALSGQDSAAAKLESAETGSS